MSMNGDSGLGVLIDDREFLLFLLYVFLNVALIDRIKKEIELKERF